LEQLAEATARADTAERALLEEKALAERRGNKASEAAEAAAEEAAEARAESRREITRVEAAMADMKRACSVAEDNTTAERSLHTATRKAGACTRPLISST